jgi:hypothetical protein
MDQKNQSVAGQNDVRLAGQVISVKTKTIPHLVEGASNS